MPFFLNKSEQRALLLVALIIISAIVIEWIKPHQIHTKIYDYTLQDSLFKALSTAPNIKEIETNEKKPTQHTKNRPKKVKTELREKSININKASKEQLKRLPRIGPKIAERIIQYRTINGKFRAIEDIKRVKGIGNKTFEKLSPYITIK